jgi:outer membrane murein-binding lipoprotein Lpp
MKKVKILLAAIFLSSLLVIAGCASSMQHVPTPASGKIDKDKIHKKNGDSDDMERLD